MMCGPIFINISNYMTTNINENVHIGNIVCLNPKIAIFGPNIVQNCGLLPVPRVQRNELNRELWKNIYFYPGYLGTILSFHTILQYVFYR